MWSLCCIVVRDDERIYRRDFADQLCRARPVAGEVLHQLRVLLRQAAYFLIFLSE